MEDERDIWADDPELVEIIVPKKIEAVKPEKSGNLHGTYVLELVEGKYYVGFSDDMRRRITEHFSGEGAKWTKRYRPINVVEIIDNGYFPDEKYYTLKYMHKYGINNVRGWEWCNVNDLPPFIEEHIMNEMQWEDIGEPLRKDIYFEDCVGGWKDSYDDQLGMLENAW